MQSFKQWRKLNESLFPLGLNNTPSVAPIQSQFQFDEKKKNVDKNPEADDDEVEDEDDDTEEDDVEDDKDVKKKSVKVKGKVKDDDEDDDEDEDEDEDEDDQAEDEGSFPAFLKKKGMKKKLKNECECDGKKPLESDKSDEDEDEDEDDKDDEDDMDDDKDDSRNEKNKGGDDGEDEKMGGDIKRPLGYMKKKMKKKNMKKESTDLQNDFLQSFNSYTTPEKEATAEDSWWASINGHMGNSDQKFSDGFTEYLEDYLIDPEVRQNFITGNGHQHDPKPGEVGHAPEGRMGGNYFGT
jgi:hypothetical protein